MGSSLAELKLDQYGRAELPDGLLLEIERHASIAAAGAATNSILCQDTSNTGCTNSFQCGGAINRETCNNQIQCSGTTNARCQPGPPGG